MRWIAMVCMVWLAGCETLPAYRHALYPHDTQTEAYVAAASGCHGDYLTVQINADGSGHYTVHDAAMHPVAIHLWRP